MAFYGLYSEAIGTWFYAEHEIFFTQSRGVALAQLSCLGHIFVQRVPQMMQQYQQQTAGIVAENNRRIAAQQQTMNIADKSTGQVLTGGVPLVRSKPALLPVPPPPEITDPKWQLATIKRDGSPELQGIAMLDIYDYEAALVEMGYKRGGQVDSAGEEDMPSDEEE